MADYFWAGITIAFLAVWAVLGSRKGRYLRRRNHNLAKVSMGLLLLCGWAGMNLAENLIPVSEHATASIIIILDSLKTAFLLGTGILVVITLMLAVPSFRNRLFKNKGMRCAMDLGEIISSVSIDNGSREFIHKAAYKMAYYLESERYCILIGGDGNAADIHECYKIDHVFESGDRHRSAAIDEDDTEILLDEDFQRKDRKIEVSLHGLDTVSRLVFYLASDSKIHLAERELNYLSGILSSRMRSAIVLESADAKINTLDLENKLYALSGRNSDLAASLKDAFAIISEKFLVDYMSVAVIDSAIQNMYRYTYAEVGGSLIERGICYPLKQTAALEVARGKRMMIANTLESDFYRDDYHLHKSGFSSRLIYPLRDESGIVKGVLTLAAVMPGALNEITEESLDFLNWPLCRMIDVHNAYSMMNTLKKQVVSSFNLTFGLEKGDGMNDFYDRSARILAETLPATMCRIWGLNHHSNSLESIGFYSLHHKPDSNSNNPGSIGLELMPRHKAAISMGKAIIVNQSNPEYSMDKSEIEALGLPGVRSAILAPMRLQNRVFGIVSVGELRNWERRSLGQQELLYSQIISTITALVREIDQKSLDLNRLQEGFGGLEKKARVYETYPNLPSKLSSSVSSLLGAAQLIRQKLPEDASELIRYNEIILKGASRLMYEIRKFDEIKKSLA
jgi:hypothetical protein